jgi:trehalose/maltose hydrolase-like predicted phosphorylase
MHSATAGALWQALVMGFGGIRPGGHALLVDPHVPHVWGAVRIPVTFRGSRVVVQVQGERLQVRARPGALVRVGDGVPVEIGPRGRRFRRSGGGWLPA